jgi:hypothetical protein
LLVFDESSALRDAQAQAQRLRAHVADKLPMLAAAMPDMAARFVRVVAHAP